MYKFGVNLRSSPTHGMPGLSGTLGKTEIRLYQQYKNQDQHVLLLQIKTIKASTYYLQISNGNRVQRLQFTDSNINYDTIHEHF